MFVGEKAETAVWERAQLMEVSYDGKLWGRWGLFGFLCSFSREEEEESRSQEEKRKDESCGHGVIVDDLMDLR